MFMLFHKKTTENIFCLESDNSEMKHKQLI